jgi:hypothetical protein
MFMLNFSSLPATPTQLSTCYSDRLRQILDKKNSEFFRKTRSWKTKRNGTKRNEKNGKFSETKRNGTEKNYKIKKRNETKRKATGNTQEGYFLETKKTKRKEKNNVSLKNQRFVYNFYAATGLLPQSTCSLFGNVICVFFK